MIFQKKWLPQTPETWLILLCALILFPVLDRVRFVMGDEAAYTDPAEHFVESGQFVSTAWPQSDRTLWSCNVPLHAATLIPWLAVFGKSLWAGRAQSLLFFLAAIWLMAKASRRNGLFQNDAAPACFTLLALCGVYTNSVGQFIRPDALGLLVLAALYFSTTLDSPCARVASMFIGGLAAILTGLQVAVMLGFFLILAFLVGLRRKPAEIVAAIAGGVSGFAGLWLLYQSQGTWPLFLANTLQAGSNRAAQWQGFRDPSLLACVTVLLTLPIFTKFRENILRHTLIAVCLSLGGALFLFGLSKFPQYYAHLATLPAMLGVSALLCGSPATLGMPPRLLLAAPLLAASLLGLPLRLLQTWNIWEQTNPRRLQALAAQILPGETVFCDPGFYFALAGHGRKTYTQFYLRSASDEEKASIDVLLLAPVTSLTYLQAETVAETLGGRWAAVARTDPLPPPRNAAIDHFFRFSMMAPPEAVLWRKQP